MQALYIDVTCILITFIIFTHKYTLIMNLQLLLTSLLAGDENEVVEFKEANNSYDFERI